MAESTDTVVIRSVPEDILADPSNPDATARYLRYIATRSDAISQETLALWALGHAPGHADLSLRMSEIRERLGDRNGAMKWAEAAFAAKNGSEMAIWLAGLQLKQGTPLIAEETLRACKPSAKEAAAVQLALAGIYEKSGRLGEALDCIDDVILGDAGNGRLHARRALILLRLGRPVEADAAQAQAKALIRPRG